jgi:hypothetical protein
MLTEEQKLRIDLDNLIGKELNGKFPGTSEILRICLPENISDDYIKVPITKA